MATNIKPKEQKALQQAQALISENNASAAKDILLAYIKRNKPGQYTTYYLNLSRAVLGESEAALSPVRKLAKKYPDNIEYLKLLGGIQHSLKQYNEAISSFQSALKINGNDFQTLSNIASSLKETKQLEEAESYFKKSLSLQPDQPDALTNYGLLLQLNAKTDEAILLHQKALQLIPEHHIAMYNLAYALNEKRQYETSLQVYLKLLELMPNHVRALCNTANVLSQLKQYEQAITYLQSASHIAPNDKDVHLSFGHIYRMTKNNDMATASYKEAQRIDPSNEMAEYFIAILTGNNSISSSPENYVQELFDDYADSFDEHLIGKLQYKTPELIGNMVTKHTDPTKKYKILDLGCGTGLAGIYLENISEHMVGVDLSEKMIKKAELRNIYDVLTVSGITQYFAAHDFHPDIVISADVFVYIGDIADVFHDVSATLEDNGLFVFSTEDTQDTETFLLKKSGRFGHNEKYIRALAEDNGFNVADNEKTIIRYEAGEAIHGQVYLLQKK